jgi:hypothetical protein
MEEKKPDEEPKTKDTEDSKSTPHEAQATLNEQVLTRSRNFETLVSYLEKNDIDPRAFLHTNKATLNRIKKGKQPASFFMVWRMERAFSNISYRLVRNGKQDLPSDEDYGFEQKTFKLRILDKFLREEKQGLTLARAMSLSANRWKNLESGWTLPSKALLRKIASYFFLPPKMLLDDSIKLPATSELKIDDDLAAIQRNDLAEQMNQEKNKHYLARNYRVLSHSMRVNMILSLVLVMLPLAGFTGYSAYTVLQDRNASLKKFAVTDITDSASKTFQSEYIDKTAQSATNPYCPVKVGTQVLKIFDIKPANEYFSVAMKVWFDFSQDDFHQMYMNYKSYAGHDADFANASAQVQARYSKDMDMFTVSSSDNSVSYGSDSIPDYIELATPYDLADKVMSALAGLSNPTVQQAKEVAGTTIEANPTLSMVHNYWTDERKSYPGLTQGTMCKDYTKNFNIGKGIDADSVSYVYAPGEAYYLVDSTKAETDPLRNTNYRMFQCCTFSAKVYKAYDNPRYPLETAQFWINITPSSEWLPVNNLRYVKADVIDVSRDQLSHQGESDYHYTCSIKGLVYKTMADSVTFTDGFRPIEGGFSSHAEAIEYDIDSTYAADKTANVAYAGLSHSKYTIVVRANRAAFQVGNFLPSTFLQAYINLAAVIIWIIIAFYNQSYAGEDSLGMLGTGMFSAISATIVGFQMLSDASMFSLVTMINVFTLAVILIMTYQAVAAKRAKAKNDKALIAYNGVKLRIMFYILTLCTLVMFIGLPIAAYIWTV